MLDICSTVQERLSEGYITSPNYPDHYPTNVDCLCTLETDWSSKITLSFYDLLLETKQGGIVMDIMITLRCRRIQTVGRLSNLAMNSFACNTFSSKYYVDVLCGPRDTIVVAFIGRTTMSCLDIFL